MDLSCCQCAFEDTAFLAGTCGAGFALFMSMVEYVLRTRCDLADPCGRAGRDAPLLLQQLGEPPAVDFIVVGAGVAGPALAARLSERQNWTVLLLEAGPEEPTATQIPAFAVAAENTVLDWNYTTDVQEQACLSTGGVCSWPRGKMVSGTGSMQGMMYTRAHRSIYDGWEAAGNEGWGYDDVLPYFIKAENNLEADQLEEGYHGTEGPLVVQHFDSHPLLSETIVEAGIQLGYRTGDLCGSNQTGVAIAQMMVKDSLRGSTPRLYLRPAAANNPKLYTGINAHVTRVLIDPETLTATGVEFLDSENNLHTVMAKKEVILSAGAIGSPQILMLSGVGPQGDLEDLGITVLKNLSVGQNLHNHVSGFVAFFINDTSYQTLTTEVLQDFISNRTGPMTGTGLTQTTGFMLSKYATDGVPDLQIFFDGFNAACSRSGLPEECSSGDVGVDCGRRYIDARPTNIMPRSKGYMKLRSSDPLDYPIFRPNYLSEKIDVDILVEGIKLVINMTRTEAMQRWGFELDTTVTAGCEDYEFSSDEYWACVVRYSTGAENHQGGTCKMGPATDDSAVVDPRFRVHGVAGLRVVDASVFPYIPNSNPISSIVMLAERAADFIKEDWPEETEVVDNSSALGVINNGQFKGSLLFAALVFILVALRV
ncbi:glucose dehydrogenase [FAD, quinone]-like [Schistocerca gregaria]|uniref:glucose dehydrogenase [FAD, quinone]-like n=1 Tax=Schistocerca gregaria TaxID=7010 RepID=UPI00211DC29C|nr:glucose dehydrogenase [FAD, quinone]-like [Schistocerca gregaria]